MKRIHLLFVAIITCTFALAFLTGNTYAVSANKEAAPVSKTAKSKTATAAKQQIAHDVNINTADKKLLTQLPGIGPVTADAILKYRDTNGQFKSIDDLTKIKGIGNKTLAKLKPYLFKI